MPNKTHEVTMETFETVVDTNPMVILYFWAGWCGPCKTFGPIFEEASEHYPDVFFGKVNTEVATDLSQAFQVRSIPTVMAFKKDELVFEQPGVLSPTMIDNLVIQLRA